MSAAVMTPKQRKWLDHIALASGAMYSGEQARFIPKTVLRQLESAGYVKTYHPHNMANKERVVITDAGRAALDDSNLTLSAKRN